MTAKPTGPLATLYRDCLNPACQQPVHCRANACKSCGHKSPWKIAGLEVGTRVHIATKNFSCMVGVSFREFTEGEVINDPALIAQLIEEECPIRPKEDWDRMILCPHCNKTFLEKPTDEAAQFSAETQKKLARLGLQ